MMTDTISLDNMKLPRWQLWGEFTDTDPTALIEKVTEAIKEFNLQPGQLVRIYEVLDQTLDRARRSTAEGKPSAPVRTRILVSSELAAEQGCGLFLITKQENESVSGVEEITEVVDLFIYKVRSTQTQL